MNLMKPIGSGKRFDIYLVKLDPTMGSEIKKNRPGVIVSPDIANRYLPTVIIAPLTSTIKPYPTRVNCRFRSKSGSVALDQLRAVDRKRLGEKLGTLDKRYQAQTLQTLRNIFS